MGAGLQVGPGAQATFKLREKDGSGKVEMWVYDDGTAPTSPKTRRGGPRWGLVQSDGRVFVTGAVYAPYLSGATTYAASDVHPGKGDKPWFKVTYLAIKRKPGWHKWSFDFNADKGLAILYDGKDVNASRARFDWNRSKFLGFNAITIIGDEGKKDMQTVWVDDITVDLGGPMKVKPVPPPPPPPVMPEKDPALEGPSARLLERVAGKHPRLLFAAEDIPRLRAVAKEPAMKVFFDRVVKYLPVCQAPNHTKFLKDATDGQRQGFWRLPTVALHYVLTGDKQSFDKTLGFMKTLLALEHWETTSELDSGMSAANIMIGAALAYDWLYNDLDPTFREQYRQKLILQARAMYHGGHLMKNKATSYWQNETHNNHRWHRDAGLALCILAAYDGKPEEQWILTKTFEELALVSKWLPEDGTTHESSSYLIFGAAHLTLAMQAADNCFGTDYLRQPFFRNLAKFRVQLLTPGLSDSFHYGDSGGVGAYNHFAFKCAAMFRQPHVQAGLLELMKNKPAAFDFGWFGLVWFDPTLTNGSVDKLPKTSFFPDIGLALLRDSWGAEGVGAMFKCGPLGGYRLNQYRNENKFKYINVAHDDPDANSFTIFAGGGFLAETSRYSKKKLSSSHNTILVNGRGQRVTGRAEGAGWTQPGRGDMTKMAVATAWKDAGNVVVVEGEAAGAYPELTRFRRTFVWVKGAYILVLDDVRAKGEEYITWLVQGPELKVINAPGHHYQLRKGAAKCDFLVVSDQEFTGKVDKSTADHRGNPLNWQQLRLSAMIKAGRVASVYTPWGNKNIGLTMETGIDDTAAVVVRGPGFTDTWEWQAPAEQFAPSSLKGKRAGGFEVVIDKDAAPPQP